MILEDVFVLPVGSRRLVFSPRRHFAAGVNAAAVRELATWAKDGPLTLPSPHGREGSGVRAVWEALSKPPAAVPPRTGPARPVFMGLIVTRRCNMACRYCDFGSEEHGNAAMSPELAAKAISGWAAYLKQLGERHMELHFFGGEPFVEPEVIEVAVHRARAVAAANGMTTRFEVSTNGFFSDRTLSFVKDYFDTVVLSLDGPRDDQDLHRPLHGGASGFDRVCATARELSRSDAELCLRCCISSANVSRMVGIAQWFLQEFQPSVINFEPLKATPECARNGLLPPDPFEFAAGFMRARRVLLARGVDATYSALFEEPRRCCCPVGQDTFIVSPTGSIRCCYLPRAQWEQKGLDLEMGRVNADGSLAIDAQALARVRHLAEERERCRNCFCRWSCAGGCLVSETGPDYTNFCAQTRLIQACVLLDDMGLDNVTDELLADPRQRELLARQTNDTLGACI